MAAALLLLLCSATLPQGGAVPCVPEGGCVVVEWPNWATAPNVPTSARPLDNQGIDGHESDPITPDDDLGSGAWKTDANGNTYPTLEICNRGGSLSGPNGKDQNGGFEGDCIEVSVTFRIAYKVTITSGLTAHLAPGGVGTSSTASVTYEIWIRTTIESEVKEVCPCGSK